MAQGALPVVPVLFFTTATQALTTLAALALAAVAPRAARELGVSAALIGYQVGIVYLGAMVSALYGGGLVRKLGATRTSQIALWLAALGLGISALGSLEALGAGGLVIGLGYGITNPPASHLLSRLPASRHMNLIFSIKQCGVPIGAMLSGLLMPPVTLAHGWHVALLVCGAMALVLGFFLQINRTSWDADRDPAARVFSAPFASLRLIWANKVLRWLALASFLLSAVQLSLAGFLVTFLVAEAGFTLVAAGTLLALTHAAGAAGRLAWGWYADRLRSGTLALMANCALGIVGALVTAAIAPGWPAWLVAAAAVLFGFSAIGWNGVFVAVIARQAPQSVGTATGGVLFITYAGIVFGPAMFAALHDRAGLTYATSFGLLAVLTAGAIGCLATARRHVVNRM